MLYFCFLNGTPPDIGWFSYAPLSEPPYSLEAGVNYWAIGLLVTSVGTIATGVNLFVTSRPSARAGHELVPHAGLRVDVAGHRASWCWPRSRRSRLPRSCCCSIATWARSSST